MRTVPKRLLSMLIMCLLLVFTYAGIKLEQADAASVRITNGTEWLDTAGNPIDAHSGNILKVGST